MTRAFDIFLSYLRRHPYVTATFCCALALFASNLCLAEPTEEYVRYCGNVAIENKYKTAGCWSCDIVFTLLMSMTEIAGIIFTATSELAMLILGLGSAIWFAAYLLKALGSFATQDPAKIIDGALTFAFKASLIYVMIAAGIDMIVYYIVQPLLQIGIDIGTVFATSTGIGGW